MPLLADIGRVLQYAQFLVLPVPDLAPVAAGPWSVAAQRELQRPGAVAHVATAARRLLVLAAARGWPALLAKARSAPAGRVR